MNGKISRTADSITRHSGRESVARVGRNPGHRDVKINPADLLEIAIPGAGYPLPGGYDGTVDNAVIG